MRLIHKLFGALMITIMSMVIILALIVHFASYRNFADYVRKIELGQTDEMIVALEAFYREHGSWDKLRGNMSLWRSIIESKLPEARQRRSRGIPPERPDPFANRNRPDDMQRPLAWDPEQVPGRIPRPLHPPVFRNGPRMGPRLTVFDTAKNPVVGLARTSENHAFRPIVVNGKTVGWLRLFTPVHMAHPLDAAFVWRQTKTMLLAVVGVLLLAVFISFKLSRHLLAPIRKLTQGTEDIRSFKFDTHIDVSTNDELGQLARDFNAMAETLKKSEDMRQKWISDIAHELRTPLAILQGEIEAMQDGVREVTTERLSSLGTEVSRIGKLVNDLHVLSIADSQSLVQQKEPIEPLKILNGVVRSFDTRLEQAGIKVQSAISNNDRCIVEGDEPRLAQLFSNLIENTIRYTDNPGILRISYFCSTDTLSIVVEDSHPGIPAEAVGQLFERLYRVDKSRSRALGGSGLGLSICKEIVTGHNGKIRADHSSLGGVLISMELPLMPQASPRESK
jgi:two-component system sensor histidine kinase BaeS